MIDPILAASIQERAELSMEMIDQLVDELLAAEGEEFHRIAERLAETKHLAKFVIVVLANRIPDD